MPSEHVVRGEHIFQRSWIVVRKPESNLQEFFFLSFFYSSIKFNTLIELGHTQLTNKQGDPVRKERRKKVGGKKEVVGKET